MSCEDSARQRSCLDWVWQVPTPVQGGAGSIDLGIVAAGGDAGGSGEMTWGDNSGGAGVERREFAMDGAGDGPRDSNGGEATTAAGRGGTSVPVDPAFNTLGFNLFEWIGGPIFGGSSYVAKLPGFVLRG